MKNQQKPACKPQITNDQLRHDAELKESEACSRCIYEQAVGISYFSLDGRFLRVNQKFCDIIGYSQEEVLKLTVQEITHPDDLKADLEHKIELLERTVATCSIEIRCLRKGGEPVWVNLTVSLARKIDGTPNFFIGLVEDISRRKLAEQELQNYRAHLEDLVRKRTEQLRDSEERHRLLAENVSDVIWTMDLSAQLTYVSPSVVRHRGYTPEETVGQTIDEILTPASAALAHKTLNEALAKAQAGGCVEIGCLELEFTRKDGSTVWSEVTFSGMYDPMGDLIGVVGASRDITERKRWEQLRSDFVSFATHQLRTPLAGIKWLLELASEGTESPDEVQSYIQDARASADRMIGLVNDLLDASRLEQGSIKVGPRKSDCSN